MNDSDIDALGVRVLDTFCSDLAPSLRETEEDDGSMPLGDVAPVEDQVVRSTEPGCEDRLEDQNKPKQKWRQKIYPTSMVRRSARIRTAKKIHDEL